MNPDNEPNPILIKLAGAVLGFAMLAFAAYMVTESGTPVIGDASGEEPGVFVSVINWVWGWPGAIVIGLLGLLVFAGVFVKSDARRASAES